MRVVLRQLMFDGEYDSPLIVSPAHHLDMGRLARGRVAAIGGNNELGATGRFAGKFDARRSRTKTEAIDRRTGCKFDVGRNKCRVEEPGIEMAVFDHWPRVAASHLILAE